MKRELILAAASVLLLTGAFSCTESLPVTEEPAKPVSSAEAKEAAFRQGAVNVKFSEELTELIERDLAAGGVVTKASSPELSDLYGSLGIVSLERVFPDAGEFEPRTRAEGLHRWYKVSYDGSTVTTKAVGELEDIPGIDIAEPIRKVRVNSYFNDPGAYVQWDFYNDGTLSESHVKGADINVYPVWEQYTTGDRKVIVGVVDGGIDYTHEDLADAYVGGYNFVSGSSLVTAHTHGTHVAGTIGAINNNSIGLNGIAGGDAAKGVQGVGLLSCQIFETDSEGNDISGDIARAIKWAADNGAVISQNSWGYYFDYDRDGKISGIELTDALNATITGADKAAVDYFIKYAGCDNDGNQLPDSPMKGGVVIFAAGNDDLANGAPANYAPIIAVGAMAPNFSRAYYSNYGDWVDIAAPGGDYTYGDYGVIYSTAPGNSYFGLQGTSMACPHVSGIAALLVSYFGGQGFTNTMLEERLTGGANTGVVLSDDKPIGPLVDALGSFIYGGTIAPDPVGETGVSVSANTITLSWKVTADEDSGKAYGYLVLAAQDKSLFNDPDYANLPSDVRSVTVLTGNAAIGDEISATITDLNFNDTYYVAIVGFDYGSNYSSLSEIKTVTTEFNHPPVISTDYNGDYLLRSHEELTIPFSISDPDGHNVSVTYEPGTDGADVLTRNNDSGEYELKITSLHAEPGSYVARIIASDGYDSASYTFEFVILENHSPVILKSIGDIILDDKGSRFTIDMSEYVEDPDGETLKYKITTQDASVLYVNPSQGKLTGTALGYGVTPVVVRALDAREKYCELEFRVAVANPDKPVTAYPNPVTDFLKIGTGTPAQTDIVILSETGRKVYEGSSVVSILDPAEVDMSSQAPGRYVVKVRIGDKEYKQTIVKK